MKDLIIVGAGPVGSQLAKKFSENGKDVLVIERSGDIGKPLACSGHVSPDIWDFVPEGERERLLQNRIKGARFHSKDGEEYRFFQDQPVSYVIDRVELDRVKAEEAMDAGAEYHLDETVTGVSEKEDSVEVTTDKDSYEAKMVAGCDGAQSRVREEVGIEDPDHFYQGLLCFTEEEDDQDFVDVFLEIPAFFGWRIPRTDSVEYGVAVPRGEEPAKWLDRVTGKFVDEEERENFCAGAIPVGPPDRVSTKRVFLAGDAAAQTKPFTGGGILYGMRCASIASETVDLDEPRSLQDYEDEWRKQLGKEIMIGKWIEKSYSWPGFIQKFGMKMFQGSIGVHMDRPTTLFSLEQLKSMFKRS